MKVYVDELPKCCLGCQLQCPYEDRCVDTTTMSCSECIGRPKDCPLQSLADYTKQVRKEVVQEIRDLAGDYFEFHWCEECGETDCSDVFLRGKDLTEILDQLQGEYK